MSFEKYIIKVDRGPTMSVHLLRALLEQYLTGGKTAQETREAIEDFLTRKNRGEPVELSTDEAQDIADTIAYITGGADLFEKKNRMDEFYRVLICAQAGSYWDTRELLRTKLAWSDPD